MKKWILFCFALVLTQATAYAQQDDDNANMPKVTVSVENDTISVGSMNLVQVKILVPTWFTQSVYFDEIESLNMISVKANKSSYPVSERIGSDTWSGVIREYSVIPMKAGNFTLDLPDVTVSYMGADNTQHKETLSLPQVSFTATVPAAAQGLSPLIIADNLTLEQSLSVPDELKAGQSIARTLTVEIDGSSALFIPQLMQDKDDDFQRAYLRPAKVNDSLDSRDNKLTGLREETQDVLLKQDGTLNLPDISIRYYNTQSQEVETVSVEGQTISVAAPDLTLKQWLVRIALAAVLLGLFALLARYINGQFKKYHASEAYQFKKLLKASHHADKALLRKTYLWRNRWQHQLLAKPKQDYALSQLILDMEEVVHNKGSAKKEWQTKLSDIRSNLAEDTSANARGLPPLNPV